MKKFNNITRYFSTGTLLVENKDTGRNEDLLKYTNFNLDLLTELVKEMPETMGLVELKEFLTQKIYDFAQDDRDFPKWEVKEIVLEKEQFSYKEGLLLFDAYIIKMNYLKSKKAKDLSQIKLPIQFCLLNKVNQMDPLELVNKIDEFFADVQGINARGFVLYEQLLKESPLTRDFIPYLRLNPILKVQYPVITSKIINIISLNLLIMFETKIGHLLNGKDKYLSDLQANYVNIQKKLLGMLDPLLRLKLQKRGIITLQNTYIGFDTEYENIDFKINKLLSIQLAVNTKTIVKIPRNEYVISGEDRKESAVVLDLYGFNNDLFKNVINKGINVFREKYKVYDSAISLLKEGLLKLQEQEALKWINDSNYDIFVFNRTMIRTGIYFDTDENGFTLSNLINEAKLLVRADLNQTHNDLLNLLQKIYKRVNVDINEIELLSAKQAENYYRDDDSVEIEIHGVIDDGSKRMSRTKMNSFTGDMVSVTKIKNIYLIAHLTNADLSMLKDFDIFKEELDIVNSSFITLGKPLLIDNNRVFIRDTMLLSPAANRSLDSIGKLYKINKIDIGTYDKSKMSVMLAENPELYKQYAIRDAVITLVHASFMEDFNHKLNKIGIPVTLSSLGTSYVKYKWEEIGYKGYQIDPNILMGDTSKLMTPRGLLDNLDIALCLPYYIAAYKGGRNECFMYGRDTETLWYDYDLTSAYTTGMATLGHPEYSAGRILNAKELLKMKDEDIINSYTIVSGKFKFPKEVKYPSIPVYVDETTTAYPLSGVCTITGIEYVLAKNQGCKFDFKEIYWIPFGDEKPFELILNEVQAKRREYPKGDINNLLYKELGNSIYGNTVRGISNKRKFDIKSGAYLNLDPCELSNPLIGSWITAFIRSVVGECLHNINTLGGKIVSCTTDGFVTDIANLESKIVPDQNGQEKKCADKNTVMLRYFQNIRKVLSGDGTALELKHEGLGIISWSTRGQFSLQSGIAATTGFQRKQFDPAFLETLFIDTLSKPNKSVEFIQQRLRSALDLYRNGGHVTKIFADRLFRLHFDNRRIIQIPEKELLANVDFSDKIFDSLPASDIDTVKYLRGMSKINVNPRYDKRLGNLTISQNKYKDYSDIAIRNFIKGVINGLYGDQIKFDNYEELIKFIKGFKPGFRISKSSISNLKHRPMILQSVPLTEEVRKFNEYVRRTYPNFDITNQTI